MPHIAALIVAAGRGVRAGGGGPKQYRSVGGAPVLAHTIRAMLANPRIDSVKVVIHPDDEARYSEISVEDPRLARPCHGAGERALSVRAGLEALADDPPEIVLIHDAARPFINAATIDAVIDAVQPGRGAFAATPVVDSLRVVEDGVYIRPLPRDGVWRAETPQAFRFDDILAAHGANDDPKAGDDVEIAHAAGVASAPVESGGDNFKITAPGDFARAEERLSAMLSDIRVGHGYDVHAFEPGDAVILCGVKVPHEKALKGHSDADVAMHTLTDAIFGAIAEGDIGRWFPPSDSQWKGAPSHIFLEKAVERVRARGGVIANVDVTIICERPKIGPHAEAMIAELSRIMGLDASRISVKATTSERLGFTGREEGIAATATATVRLP
ncbi:MAG: bifunctional 2-C-methyl-D-erythritol 4-phosphate cytidylyltransferase/2-C-methyl-D-erythritol 2,4-cyclodiphosphate synthase [Pseudomonadota bacterium]